MLLHEALNSPTDLNFSLNPFYYVFKDCSKIIDYDGYRYHSTNISGLLQSLDIFVIFSFLVEF